MKLLDKKRIYVVGGNYAIEKIFSEKGGTLVSNLDDADIVCFTGGADVSPGLYGEERHPTTMINEKRDAWEKVCFLRAEKKLKVGICRGGQFLNVMNGGSLWQDVDCHAISGEHPLMYETFIGERSTVQRSVMVTSTHHQMMIPSIKNGAKVWAWAGLSTKKSSGIRMANKQWLFVEPKTGHQTDAEIVFYPRTKSLCFQPHPEYNSRSTHDLFFTCVERAMAS